MGNNISKARMVDNVIEFIQLFAEAFPEIKDKSGPVIDELREIRKALLIPSNTWDDLLQKVNELHAKLQNKPDSEKRGYSHTPGGILNAYREGDISFDDAVKAINTITNASSDLAEDVLRKDWDSPEEDTAWAGL